MKIASELEVVKTMINLYCDKKHKSKGKLCNDCLSLNAYVEERLLKCPFEDNKSFCSNCKIHCYSTMMQDKIRRVMKFSGPIMIFYHPKIAIKHLIETKISKKHNKE